MFSALKNVEKVVFLEIQQLLFINRKEDNPNPDFEYLYWIGKQIRGTHLRILKNPRSGKIWETATGKRKEVWEDLAWFSPQGCLPALLKHMWASP